MLYPRPEASRPENLAESIAGVKTSCRRALVRVHASREVGGEVKRTREKMMMMRRWLCVHGRVRTKVIASEEDEDEESRSRGCEREREY